MKKEKLWERVEEALDSVRPHLEADGGDVELVEITPEKAVKIRWVGNCENCFMSVMTMKAGIEQAIMNKVPEITSVKAINGMEVQ